MRITAGGDKDRMLWPRISVGDVNTGAGEDENWIELSIAAGRYAEPLVYLCIYVKAGPVRRFLDRRSSKKWAKSYSAQMARDEIKETL